MGCLNPRFAIIAQIYLKHESGVCVFLSMDNLDSPWNSKVAPVGHYKAHCVIPAHFLNEGMFTLEYCLCTSPTTTEYVWRQDVVTFYVIDDMANEGVRGTWGREWFSSLLRPRLQWTHFKPAPLLTADANRQRETGGNVTACHMADRSGPLSSS